MLFVSACALIAAASFTGSTSAQDRQRVVKTSTSQPTNLPPAAAAPQPERAKPIQTSRPTLTNDIVVNKKVDPAFEPPLVKKTGSSMPTNAPAAMAAAGKTAYNSATSVRLDSAIKSRYGIRYRYGSTG